MLKIAKRLLIAAFADGVIQTNQSGQLFICALPQPSDLNVTAFAALTWVEVKGVGNLGAFGNMPDVLSYNTWGGSNLKAKGSNDSGNPALETARMPTDPGQILLRTAGADGNVAYAFKRTMNDKQTSGGAGTIRYFRALVTGPEVQNGRTEDFDLENYVLGIVQKPATVDAT